MRANGRVLISLAWGDFDATNLGESSSSNMSERLPMLVGELFFTWSHEGHCKDKAL